MAVAGHPQRMKMVWSSGDVGFAWCCEPVTEWDAGASGTHNCCREHEPQTP
jgi:hypothetical protein